MIDRTGTAKSSGVGFYSVDFPGKPGLRAKGNATSLLCRRLLSYLNLKQIHLGTPNGMWHKYAAQENIFKNLAFLNK